MSVLSISMKHVDDTTDQIFLFVYYTVVNGIMTVLNTVKVGFYSLQR